MVLSTSALGSTGLKDWVYQRVSAIVLVAFLVVLMGFMFTHPDLTHAQWKAFFAHPLMRMLTIFTLLSLAVHSWIGIWTVFTDYINPVGLRLMLTFIVIISLIAYFFWGVMILWRL